jgi:PB1 domain/Zinc finger, ZZ type
MFIKAEFRGQKRKFKLNDSCGFAELLKELVRCFGSDINQRELGYIDDDQEFIRVTNDEEWQVCVEEFGIRNQTKLVNSLEIKIRESGVSLDISNPTQSFACLTETKSADDDLKNSIGQWNLIGEVPQPEVVAPESPELTEGLSNIEPDLAQSQMTCPDGFILKEDPNLMGQFDDGMQVEDSTAFPKYTNTSEHDIVVDMKISGTPEELARLQHSITHQFAPLAGFSIDKSEIQVTQEEEKPSELNSSVMTQELKDEIESMIEEKIARVMKKSKEPTVVKSTYNHFGIICDICTKTITSSCRYKSLVKKDFDICDTCEATGIHPEPLIKIRAALEPNISYNVNEHYEELKAVFDGKQVMIKTKPCESKLFHTNNFAAPTRGLAHIRPAAPVIEPKVTIADKFAEMGKMIPEMPHSQPTTQFAPCRPLAHIRPAQPVATAPAISTAPESESFKNMHRRIMSIFPSFEKAYVSNFIKQHDGCTLEEIICKLMDENKL